MKRSFLYLALGAMAALSACTSEDVLEDAVKQNNVIGFENVVNKHSRAVTDLNTANMQKFYVFGFYTTPNNNTVAVEVFKNVEVTKQDNLKWKYTQGGDRYWVPNAHYYFYAYSCGAVAKLDDTVKKFGEFSMDMENGLTPAQRVLMIKNYVCDYTHQHDLVFASNTGATETDPFAGIVGKTSGNDDVSMKFSHILSKVQAQFTSAFPEDYTVEISNVRISNFHNQGTYNPSLNDGKGAWENVAHKDANVPYVYLLGENDTDENVQTIETKKGGNPAKTDAAYVLPYVYDEPSEENDAKWVYINFDLVVKNKQEIVYSKDGMVGHFNPTWDKGYTYTYNIEISGDAANLQIITFTTATGEDWKTGTDPHTITIEK